MVPVLCNTSHLKNPGINKDKSNEVPRMSMDHSFMSQEDEKASANPIMVMADERTGEKYARAVGHKGMGKDQDMEWLIKDMSNELKVLGHSGGTAGNIRGSRENGHGVCAGAEGADRGKDEREAEVR